MAMPAGLARYWRQKRGAGRRRVSRRIYTKGRRRSGGIRLPLAIVAGFMPLIGREIQVAQIGGLGAVPQDVAGCFLPYNVATRKFDTSGLNVGLIPVLVGILVHKVIGGYLGLNRSLAGAGIPFVRI